MRGTSHTASAEGGAGVLWTPDDVAMPFSTSSNETERSYSTRVGALLTDPTPGFPCHATSTAGFTSHATFQSFTKAAWLSPRTRARWEQPLQRR